VHQTRCDKKAEVDKAKAAEAAALAHQTVEVPTAAAVEPSRHPLKRRLLGFINEEQQSSALSPSASSQQPVEHSLPKLPRKVNHRISHLSNDKVISSGFSERHCGDRRETDAASRPRQIGCRTREKVSTWRGRTPS